MVSPLSGMGKEMVRENLTGNDHRGLVTAHDMGWATQRARTDSEMVHESRNIAAAAVLASATCICRMLAVVARLLVVLATGREKLVCSRLAMATHVLESMQCNRPVVLEWLVAEDTGGILGVDAATELSRTSLRSSTALETKLSAAADTAPLDWVRVPWNNSDTQLVAAGKVLLNDAVALRTSFVMWGAASGVAVEKACCALNYSFRAVYVPDLRESQLLRACSGSTAWKFGWSLVSSEPQHLAQRMLRRPFETAAILAQQLAGS